MSDIPAAKYGASWWHQLSILFRRNMYDYVRDKEKFASLCSTKLTVSILVGLCWWSQGSPPSSLKAITITGCLFVFMMNCCMDNIMVTALRFPANKQIFLNEYKNGCYSSGPWFIAFMGHLFIIQTFMAFLLLLPAYFMIQLRMDLTHLSIAVATIFVAGCVGATAGVLAGTAAKDFEQANSLVLPLVMPLILFSGYVIPYKDIPSFFQWIYFVDLFQWGFTILRLNQFDGLEFEDCPPLGTAGAWCNCEGQFLPPCTGTSFLKTIDLDPNTHPIWPYFMYMLCFLTLLLVAAFALIRCKGTTKTG